MFALSFPQLVRQQQKPLLMPYALGMMESKYSYITYQKTTLPARE